MTLGGHERIMILLAGLLVACARGGPGDSIDGGPGDAGSGDPGALVRVTMPSKVGVLLDEIPAGMRERVAKDLLDQGPEPWTQRARYQLEHTIYRLVFRQFYYQEGTKLQLPLPPPELWTITFDPGGAERTQINGHDMVVIGYTLDTLLLSDAASPADAEPALAEIGGTWDEPFLLPVDPMFLFQRTGYACMNEEGFPLHSVFEENARWFFDHTCDVEDPKAPVCHLTAPEAVTSSCVEALDEVVGKVETAMRFERLAWDPDMADSVRIGAFTKPDASDLEPIADALENHWLVYRYIAEDSCAIAEDCVGGPGWRRLLMFDASAKNVGGADMNIGFVDFLHEGLGSELIEHNVFEYGACHQHYHFRFYGDFRYGTEDEQVGNKQAFCLQTTQRYFNNEGTSLTTPYGSCTYQGISAGWGDDYMAGLDCQWIDVTDVDVPGDSATHPLSFEMNPDGFLCEGDPVTDDEGNQVFEPTMLVTEQGEPIDRPACDQAEGWDTNNLAQRDVEISRVGSFIQDPCPAGALGHRRDCGFTGGTTPVSCTAGETVTLACQVSAGTAAHVARFCEVSDALGTGVACAYRESVASAIVTDTPVEIAFPCPMVRDAAGASGGYSMYTAPVYGADAAGQVTCVPDA
jgi:hypothetical protein